MKQPVGRIDFEGLRAVINWSPTGVVVYSTHLGWQVRKDSAVLYGVENCTPRAWQRVDRALDSLKDLGVKEVVVQLA